MIDWTYKESILLINGIKDHYEYLMLFFDASNNKVKILEEMREIKKKIYDLKFEEWKRDKLWEYINDDIEYSDLWNFV